jgi:hypothetical protein
MSAPRDMSSVKRFLGIDGSPDDRALLDLPAGDLKSGQIEAALERRTDAIARHPLGTSVEARRLVQQLENAADRLQAEIALIAKGPLHPAAARRAAKKLQSAGIVAGGAPGGDGRAEARPIVKPAAIAQDGARSPGRGLTAEDLTDFDRLALALLVVSGGWNAKSAKRLATVAEEYGVSVEHLDRIVKGLTEFLAEGDGLRGAMGDVGREARSAWLQSPAQRTNTDAAEGAVERVLGRINDVIRAEVTSGSQTSQVRLAVLFGGMALLWIGVLAWLFFRSEEAPVDTTPPARTAAAELPAQPERPVETTTGANGETIAPVAALAAPAKFPRAPGFVPSKTPKTVSEAASAGAQWIGDLEDTSRQIRVAKGKLGEAPASRAAAALSSAADAWPAATGYRADVVRAAGQCARELRGADALRRFMQLVPGSVADANRAGLAPWQRIWRTSFGAGVLGAIALDATQPPEVAAAAREEMRVRSIAIPRGQISDAFGASATGELARGARELAEEMALGTIADLEDASRWAQAVDVAATNPALRARAAKEAIDAALRSPGALDKPGPLVDFLAYAIHMLDYSGRGSDAPIVRDALGSWIVDAAIPPSRIWVFTSLLDADLGIAWYGPDLVLATNADAGSRTALAERVLAAFPAVGSTAIGQSILVEGSRLDDWRKNLALLDGLPEGDAADRLRNAAAALAAARNVRAFELGDVKLMKAANEQFVGLMAREAKEWDASPTGERAGLPASGVRDGDFAAAWRAAGRAVEQRIDLARTLAARPSAGDLGPIDAQVVALEALRGNQPDVRDALATALVDRYSNGPEVLRAVLDVLAEGVSGTTGSQLVSGLVGTTVAGADWQSEARARLIEKIHMLEDSRHHAVDAASAEIASVATALASTFGRTGAGASAPQRADRALAVLADSLRDEAATKFLATPFPAPIDEIERLRAARRGIARSVSQRMAAETPAILDYTAMLVSARQPALQSKLTEILNAARRDRAAAGGATEQVQGDLRAMLAVLAEVLAPEATRRDDDA